MTDTYDVLIIGSGIMGTSIAFELSKKGYRTLTIDKQPEAGLGSTSSTCAIIRTTYSTMQGTAIAYDSYFSWKNGAACLPDWKISRGSAAPLPMPSGSICGPLPENM